MPRGIADIFQVIVFATGTNATLGGGGPVVWPFVPSEEYIFELHHTGISEQQSRIVQRHQWAAGDLLMAFGCKEIEECVA